MPRPSLTRLLPYKNRRRYYSGVVAQYNSARGLHYSLLALSYCQAQPLVRDTSLEV